MPLKRPRPPARPKVSRPAIGPPPVRRPAGTLPKSFKRPAPPPPPPKSPPRPKAPDRKLAGTMGVFGGPEPNRTLLDLVDNLLSRGVVLHADAILALADVDLVYLQLTALLAAADRVLPNARTRGARAAGRKPAP